MPNNSFGILDTRNGIGYSISIETQMEVEKSIGVNTLGIPRFLYIANAPQIIKKTTYNVIATGSEWSSFISTIANNYKSISTAPIGLFTESANPSGGRIIIDKTEYFQGTYVEADYSNLDISNPPDEYKILINDSASISPSGFLPNGTSYYSTNQFGKTFTRTSTISLSKSNQYKVGSLNVDKPSGLITSKSLSNQRYIGSNLYVDMSLQIAEMTASITI